MTTEQIQEARQKAQVIADLSGEPYVDPHPDFVEKKPDTPDEKPDNSKLSNEELITMLNERAGIKLSSLDDLKPQPTPEEIQAAKDKRESDKLTYGLNTGKFKKEDYDAYQKAQANKLEIIKSDLTEKLKTAYPELSDEVIDEKIAVFTGENIEDEVLKSIREQELIELADNRLKKQFANIYNLDNDFEQHEQGINSKVNFENKVKAALPVYQSDIKKVLNDLASIDVLVPDHKNPENNVSVKLSFSEADLKEVEDVFLTPDTAIQQIKSGYTPEALKDAARLILRDKHFDRLVSKAAKDYNSLQKEKYLKGRKGLMSGDFDLDIADDNLEVGNNEIYDQLIKSAESQKI